MLTPEQKAVLFFIVVCLVVILLGALTDKFKGRDVARDMQEDHDAQYGEAERQSYEEFEHQAGCSDLHCEFCDSIHSNREVNFV